MCPRPTRCSGSWDRRAARCWPRSRDADLANAAFPFGTSRWIDLGYARVRASRITYVGELGYELYIPTEFAQHVYDVIVERGRRRSACSSPAITP